MKHSSLLIALAATLAAAGTGLGLAAQTAPRPPAASAPAPQPTDTRSPACREALQALQLAEAQGASAPRGQGDDLRLQPARERASRACLGGPAGARPTPMTQSPLAVPPVSRPSSVPAPRLPPMASPPPPPVVTTPAPVTILACDTTGCIASDGSRLNKVGPTLVGPRGACTLEGAVLRCPQ